MNSPEKTSNGSGQGIIAGIFVATIGGVLSVIIAGYLGYGERPTVSPAPTTAHSTPPAKSRTETPTPSSGFENSLKMKFICVPAGVFEMGSPQSEGGRENDEKVRYVQLTQGFYLSAYEVTQSEFQQVLGRNPAFVRGQETASFPVENVTWFDAVEFCNALSKREDLPEFYTLTNIKRKGGGITSAEVAENDGNGYRLPTEAEWEYACRAGTKTPFHFGETLNGNEANVNGNFPYGTSITGPFLDRTSRVGSYPPNAFGLYDMHGNVWEWCNDRYQDDYGGDARDPKGADSGLARVLRGGAFVSMATNVRSANRFFDKPPYQLEPYGIRVAKSLR